MFIHNLPRAVHSLDGEPQRAVLDNAPPVTGTRWDALLAAIPEHLAELERRPTREWMDEPERFLDHTCVFAHNAATRANALGSAPPALVRHRAVIDPRQRRRERRRSP